jgi:hypothetical protein
MRSLLATQVLRRYKEDSFRNTRMTVLLMPLHNNENRMLRCHTEFEYVEDTSLFYNIYENIDALYLF